MHSEIVTLFGVPEFDAHALQGVLLRRLNDEGVSAQFEAQGRLVRITVTGAAVACKGAAARLPDWYMGWRGMRWAA